MVRALISAGDALGEYAMGDVLDERDAIWEEAEAVAASRRVLRPILEARLQARVDHIDRETTGQATCLKCGEKVESHGRRRRTWESTFGAVALRRRWSVCAEHSQGRSVAQERLLLPETG